MVCKVLAGGTQGGVNIERTAMPFMNWNDEYSVNVTLIDQQHKKLFGLLNDLSDGLEGLKGEQIVEKVLADLTFYAEAHFATEERLMQLYGYARYREHKAEHDDFTRRVADFQRRIDSGGNDDPVALLRYMRNWLSAHILGTDKLYAPQFRQKGAR